MQLHGILHRCGRDCSDTFVVELKVGVLKQIPKWPIKSSRRILRPLSNGFEPSIHQVLCFMLIWTSRVDHQLILRVRHLE